MAGPAMNRVVVIFGFFLGIASATIGLLTGADVFTVIVERFMVAFAVGAGLSWLALSVISSVVVGAARKTVEEIRAVDAERKAAKARAAVNAQKEAMIKGLNLDLTSEPEEITIPPDVDEAPEVQEFAPFRPRSL